MRKNSNQILKEIYLDEQLDTFKQIVPLRKAISDFENFKENEYDALHLAIDLTKKNPILKEWVEERIAKHYATILSLLGLTTEGFKDYIKKMEVEQQRYAKIRNEARKQVHSGTTKKLH